MGSTMGKQDHQSRSRSQALTARPSWTHPWTPGQGSTCVLRSSLWKRRKEITLMFLGAPVSQGQEDLPWRPRHIRKEQRRQAHRYTSLRPVEMHMDIWPVPRDPLMTDDRILYRLSEGSVIHVMLKNNYSFPLVSSSWTCCYKIHFQAGLHVLEKRG